MSAADGKIKTVEETGENYTITFEGDNYFRPHDLIRCQVYFAENPRGYWVEVLEVTGCNVVVARQEFTEWGTVPLPGDECVLMGNTIDPLRQNLISISATEDGQPRIDILNGVRSKSLTGCLRTRLGNLDGIKDVWFPEDNQPHGDGLYSDNAYLRGSFLLTTGEDVRTKFEIVEGRIQSVVEAVRNDFAQDKNFLSNPAFASGLDSWGAPAGATKFLALGGQPVWAGGALLAEKGEGTNLIIDADGRRVVRLRRSSLWQRNDALYARPDFATGDNGKKQAASVYLSFIQVRAGRAPFSGICRPRQNRV